MPVPDLDGGQKEARHGEAAYWRKASSSYRNKTHTKRLSNFFQFRLRQSLLVLNPKSSVAFFPEHL
jgi:hypothetical protein